jgi:glutamine synthetase
MAEIDKVPTSLGAVLDNLESDHDFLTAGGVFTSDLIETWIDYKRENEILPVQLRPHPHEFELYYDI